MEPSADPLADLDFDVDIPELVDLSEPVDLAEPRWWVRPVLARLSLLAVVIGVLVLMWQEPVEAHGGITLVVAGDGRGAVTVSAEWVDGHPVTDPLGAIITGSSDAGAQVGPVALRAVGGTPGVVGYTGLAPGLWTVVIDVGSPGIARCEARLAVAAAGATPGAAPTSIRCAAPSPALEEAAETSDGGSSPPWLAMGLLLVALVAAGVLFAIVARRLAPARSSARSAGSVTRRTRR